jgi:predicted MFS family arabinose efflux permease
MMSLLNRYFHAYHNFSKATWINILAVFIMSFGLMMSSIFTLFLNQRGVGILEISSIIAIGGVGGVLGSYLCGILAKYISPTRIAQYSLVCSAMVTLVFPWLPAISYFFLFYFLGNFFNGLFRPANNLMLFAHAPIGEHTRVMALYRVAFNLGLACATSIGAFLATISFSWFFIFSAMMAFAGGIVLFIYNKLLHIEQNKNISTTDKIKSPALLMNFFRQYKFLLLSLLFFSFYLIFNQTRVTYSLFLTEDYQLNLQHIGWLFMINFLLVVFLEVPLMTWLKQTEQTSLIMWGSLCVGLGMFILPFGDTIWFAALSVLLWSVGEILATSPFFVLAYRYAAPDARSFYIGIFHSVFSLSLVLGPLIGGFLYPINHGYLLWSSCGGLTILMLFGFLYLKKSARESKRC